MSAPPRLFDKALAARRLERAIRQGAQDFLFQRAVQDLQERLAGVRRGFETALDLASPAAVVLPAARVTRALCEDETLPFADDVFDIVVSLLALHQVNDLPGLLIQVRRVLTSAGLFLAALPGGETLCELRESLMLAESELCGGVSPRVIPFADVRALGGLLQRAGFVMPVVDVDQVLVRYTDFWALMRDLRAFGATCCLVDRAQNFTPRGLFVRAGEIYAERFADADGRIRATFEILWMTAWKS